jgi:hypothetical protein
MKKNISGIALILIISIIAFISLAALGLIVVLRFEGNISYYLSDNYKALQLADAGIQRAIGEIEKDAKSEFIDDLGDSWTAGYTDNTLLGGLGEYDVTIVDCQRQVNINNASANLLAELPGIDAALAAAIIAARPFETKREIMKVAGIGEGTYNNLKDYITIISWSDPSCNDRSPININTADEIIVKAVLKGTGLSDASVNTAYTALNGAITGLGPFYLWADFDNVIDSTSLNATEKDIIKTNANPNRNKPSMYTTEFCFFSGGYYEITSTGKIYETTNQNNIAAIRTINTVVQLFKTIYYTTKEDFRGEDANYNLVLDAGEDLNGNGVLDIPLYQNVTWLDSCPINASSLFGAFSIDSAECVAGALKIGYWDNFDEDIDYSMSQWVGDYAIANNDSDSDNELYYATATSWPYPVFSLNNAYKWTWQNYSLRVYEYDSILPWQMKEVGWVMCGSDLSSGNNVGIHLGYPGPLEWGNVYYRDIGGEPVMSSNSSYPLWIFSAQLRRWPDNGDIDNYWTQHPDLPSAPAYDRAKTFNISNSSLTATAKAYDSTGANSTLSIPQASSGTLTLYGQNQRPIWDDLRIISDSGNYVSATYVPREGSVVWGSFWATYAIQADTSINFEIDTGSGFNSIITNSPLNSTSTSIRYKVNMTSTAAMQNTPLVEDILITYFIPIKVLYRNEN